jgi:predicted alpha/beta-fold hydrolase
MEQFVPRAALAGGHRMTLYGWGNPRRFNDLPAAIERYFDTAPRTRVLAHCHWQPRPSEHPTILALHGLNGSSDSHYMKGIAAKAFARGMNVVRLNQRNCGNTEHLAPGLFHSGLTEDARHVIDELARVDRLSAITVAGYSLGGNLALKLAGEFGDNPPAALTGVAAVSPIIEIGDCVNALERRSNVVYEWNFVRELKKRMVRKERFWPGLFDLSKLKDIRTVRQFDDEYTAPHFGFLDAEDYYYRCSALRIADRIRVPALIISAEDDPFVPSAPFRNPVLTSNPAVLVHVTEHGGHCGFVAAATTDYDGYWAERQIVRFVERTSRERQRPAAVMSTGSVAYAVESGFKRDGLSECLDGLS